MEFRPTTIPILLALAGCLQPFPDQDFTSLLLLQESASSASSISDFSAPTVTIGNLTGGAKVETGYLIGTATADNGTSLSLVEVEIDGGGYATASGTESWTYQLPIGSFTWKHGSSHTISVRSQDATGSYSTVATITVTKGENRDVNGDGYPDKAIGAVSTGRAYLFHGNAAGTFTSSATSANTIIDGENANDRFGLTTGLADVNGDGYGDLAVSADQYPTGNNQGRVYVFHGTASSGITTTAAAAADTILTGEAVSDRFGWTVSFGDVNGDGYTDLASSATQYNAGQGRTYIFQSAGATGIAGGNASAATRIVTGENNTNFGHATKLTDVNADGFSDLISSGPGYNTNQGRVYILYSSGAGGITNTTATGGGNTILTGEASNDQFGACLALGDVNADGMIDLAAGANQFNTNQGKAYIFHNNGSGFTTMGAGTADTIITGEASSNDFGIALDLGDLDRDGDADLAVGAYQFNTNQGRVYLFTSTSAIASGGAATAGTVITGETTGNDFGLYIRLLDSNADGYPDLFTSARSYGGSVGRAYLFKSSASGITTTAAGSADSIIVGEAASNFGTL